VSGSTRDRTGAARRQAPGRKQRSSSTVSSSYVSPGLTVEQMINELRQAKE
jgi:hypothetical protein